MLRLMLLSGAGTQQWGKGGQPCVQLPRHTVLALEIRNECQQGVSAPAAFVRGVLDAFINLADGRVQPQRAVDYSLIYI